MKYNDDQFREILSSNQMGDNEDDDYLMSFVECDNCGQDTHMDDTISISPSPKERKQGAVTNFYCGPACRDLHQSSARKGMIGNPFVQMGWDPEKSFKKGDQ